VFVFRAMDSACAWLRHPGDCALLDTRLFGWALEAVWPHRKEITLFNRTVARTTLTNR
jgi:hypothetical protein